MKNFYVFVFLLILSVASFAQGKYLDKTFGFNGIATTKTESFASLNTILVQPDNKIIAAGNIGGNFAVIRYNANGSLDKSFGTGGTVTTSLGRPSLIITVAAVLQPDGKIIVGSTKSYNKEMIVLLRYNKDGSIDSTFGHSGEVVSYVNYYTDLYAMALQPDGKIVVGAQANYGDSIKSVLIRYYTGGKIDNKFGDSGIASLTYYGTRALTLQPDGKILVAGLSDGASIGYGSVARFTADGKIDLTFSKTGVLTDHQGQNTSIAVQRDGKIIVAGKVSDGEDPTVKGIIHRLNPDGSTDTTYGNDGFINSDDLNPFIPQSILLQPDGKLLVTTSKNRETFFGIMRYNINGKIDSTFGNNGFISITNKNIGAGPLALTQDGKILAGSTLDSAFLIARLIKQDDIAPNNQQKNLLNISVHPNPVNNILYVDGLMKNIPVQITISDLSGNIVKTGRIINNNSVDVSKLKPGQYVAVFYQQNKKGSFKFFKQ